MCWSLCVNDPGSFHCDCYPGYTLNPDMASCSGRFIMKKLMSCRSEWVCYRSCQMWSEVYQYRGLVQLPLWAWICTEYWWPPLWWYNLSIQLVYGDPIDTHFLFVPLQRLMSVCWASTIVCKCVRMWMARSLVAVRLVMLWIQMDIRAEVLKF